MSSYLVMKLSGVMQAWGKHTFEDFRPSHEFPTRSGVVGLIAACLGLDRRDQASQHALSQSFSIGVRRDFHQLGDHPVPYQKLVDFHTAKNVRKVKPGAVTDYSILTRREYLCDAHFTVLLKQNQGASFSLEQVRQALQKPKYTPTLGRRSCPLSRPLLEKAPEQQIIEASTMRQAFDLVPPYRGRLYLEVADVSEADQEEWVKLQIRDVPIPKGIRQFSKRFLFTQEQGGPHAPE